MTDPKVILQRLQKSLNFLQERKAKYGFDVPVDLLHEIEDHQTAIGLTERLAAGHLSEADWREQLGPLLVKVEEDSGAETSDSLNIDGVSFSQISGSTVTTGDITSNVTAGGDIVGGDKVTQTAEGSNIAQAMQGGHAEVNSSIFDQWGQQVSGDQYNAEGDMIINQTPLESKARRYWSVGVGVATVIGVLITTLTVPQFNAWIFPAPTPTVTPTAAPTATPSPTPLAFEPAGEGETLIVITTFEEVGDGQSLPHREIKHEIDQALTELALDDPPRVEIHSEVIPATDRAAAERLGQVFNASLIIWGTDTNARVSVNFLNLKDLESPVPEVQLDETARSQLANPPAYVQYITEDLPDQLAFLSLFAIGRSFVLQADYPAAINSLERAVRDVADEEALPGLAAAYFELGWLYQNHESSPAEAANYYTGAIDLGPEDAAVYNNRGVAYDDLGQYEQAVEDYGKAIELGHDPLAWPYNNRGVAYDNLGQYEQAIEDYDKAIELDPEYALAYNNRGIAYTNLGQYEQAIRDYGRAIELGHDPLAWPYNNRGVAYDNLGQYEQAIEDYDKAIELDPEYTLAYNNRGFTYYSLGQYEQAIEDFNKVIDLDPEYALAFDNRGAAYADLGQYEQAMEDFNKAIELDPEDAAAHNDRCWWGSLLNGAEEVMASCEQAVALAPDNGNVRDSRGLARALTGDYEGASEDFRFYIEGAAEDGSITPEEVEQRQVWVKELEAGRNPFDARTLLELRGE